MYKNILFALILGLFSCQNSVQSQTAIDAAKTEQLLKADSTVQLLDVRTPAEWENTGVIEGAKKINFKDADFDAQLAKLDKEKPVIVYCAAGGRSPKAAAKLVKMGFKTVYDYSGGMNDWKAKGKKTVK